MLPEKAIPELELGLRKTTLESIYVVGDRLAAHKELQEAIVAIPGHAKYIATRIKESYAYDYWRLKYPNNNDTKPETTIADLQSPARECKYGFETLAQLPTPETVKVLGEFLDDELGMKELLAAEAIREESKKLSELHAGNRAEWSKVDGIIDDSIIHPAVAVEAASTLGRLPLKSKPKIKVRTVEDLQVWKNWYQQIKEGRRTFSFEGDPREYDLTGPVREARNPDIARVTKRPEVSGKAKAHRSGSSAQSVMPWIVMALMLAVGVLCYGFKRRGPVV
jgi:hypothetical protein